MTAIVQAPSGGVFDFLRRNDREPKPRIYGITEIRGPYYAPLGKRVLQDILETMGPWVDALKFAGGSFTLMSDRAPEELISLCHEHGVLVSTGGFIERVLTQGSDAVAQYIDTCRAVGFDIIELSSGFITIPADDWLRLIDRVQRAGLKAKPEVGIQFGAGGATAADDLTVEGSHDVAWVIQLAPVPRCGRLSDNDRIGGDHGERPYVAHRCSRAAHRCARTRAHHVRGGGSGGLRVVYQALWAGGEPFRGSQPDCAARVVASGNLGHRQSLGTRRYVHR